MPEEKNKGLALIRLTQSPLERLVDAVEPGRADVLCPKCSTTLMSAVVLPPGSHDLQCPVCEVNWPVKVSGGTLTRLAAVAASAADEILEIQRQKRAEALEVARKGNVEGPLIPLAIAVGSAIASNIVPILISVGLSIGTSLLSAALRPAQRVTRGSMTGPFLIPQSEQGLGVPEIVGARPADTAWQANHAFSIYANVAVGANYFKAMNAGTSGGTAPTWPSSKGQTVNDNGITWQHMGKNGGGSRTGMLIAYASKLRKRTSTSTSGGGKKQPRVQTTNVEYSLDLGILVGRGPLNVLRITANAEKVLDKIGTVSGVLDPTVEPDPDFELLSPPDPEEHYTQSTDRFNDTLTTDGTGTQTGTLAAGLNATVRIYPGNFTQLPDPTYQADVDSRLGDDSTPAMRGRCFVMFAHFFLTKYGGSLPILNFVSENTSYKTLAQAYAQWCDRTGVLLSSDYDFSDVASLDLRGLSVTPKYRPREPMEALARVFNVVFSESDKIYAKRKGVGAVVATIDDSEMGWVSADAEADDGPLQELDTTLEPETSIVRKVEVRYVNPEKDFEPDESHHQRQVTQARGSDTLELQVTMYPDEAKAVAQREVYEAELKSQSHKTTLDWSYLWVKAGDEIAITRDEGFTQRVRVVRIVHNIGPIEVEFEPVETAVYVQPAVAPEGVFEPPPVPIPAMSILGLYDGPLLTDAENSVNNGAGVYGWWTKRTGDGTASGATLVVDRGLGFEELATFDTEATTGRTADDSSGVLTSSTNIHGIVSDAVTVDLYGTTATLEGATDEELWAGANHCLIGEEICQIKSATKVGGFSNRWNLVIGRRGLRGTDFALDDHLPGERFLLINGAVKFIPLDLNELNIERPYKLVTSGQSLDDAATVLFAFTGGSLKPLAPAIGDRQPETGVGDLLITLTPRTRVGAGLHPFFANSRAEEEDRFYLKFPEATPNPRTVQVVYGEQDAVLLLRGKVSAAPPGYYTLQTINNTAGSIQAIAAPTLLSGPSLLALVNEATGEICYQISVSKLGSGVEAVASDLSGGTLGFHVVTSAAAAKVGIRIRGGEVFFYASQVEGVPLSEFARSTVWAGDKPSLRGYVLRTLTTVFTSVKVDSGALTYVYKQADQIADFGALLNPGELAVEAWQHSAFVGQGYVAERTL